VDNVVEANLLAAKAQGIAGEVINIGCGERFTINTLVAQLNRILGTNIEPEYKPARQGDVRHSLASIEKAKELLGYTPTIPFEEGLRRTVEWFRTKSRG
jgi:UDP-glucose 4-epimerase